MVSEGGQARRIVVVLHDLPLGGTERIAVRLANRWAQLGREVTLFCGVREGPLAMLICPHVKAGEAAPPVRRGPGSRKRLRAALAAYLERRPTDLLFVPGNYQWP